MISFHLQKNRQVLISRTPWFISDTDGVATPPGPDTHVYMSDWRNWQISSAVASYGSLMRVKTLQNLTYMTLSKADPTSSGLNCQLVDRYPITASDMWIRPNPNIATYLSICSQVNTILYSEMNGDECVSNLRPHEYETNSWE